MATKPIKIFQASNSDLSIIQALFYKMFEIFYVDQNIDYPYTEDGIQYLKNCIEHQIALVAKDGDTIIAFLTGGIEDAMPFKTYKQHGHLHNLFVLEDYRRQGIGKQLVQQFVQKCAENDVHRIVTDSDNTEALKHFYTSQGFRISSVNYEWDIPS